MFKKCFFSLILFSTPLFSMDPKALKTQTLKHEIAKHQQLIAILKRIPLTENEFRCLDFYDDSASELQLIKEKRLSLKRKYKRILHQYKTELATRADR